MGKEKGLIANKLSVYKPSKMAQFYVDNFGMEISEKNEDDSFYRLAFPLKEGLQSISLELTSVSKYEESEKVDGEDDLFINGTKDDVYWKVGFALKDVVRSVDILREKGISCSDPKQFKQVGFMSHLNDSNGFSLELLQNTFKWNFSPSEPLDGYPLKEPLRFGQLTLRINKLDENLIFYQNNLGMKLLAIEEVEEFGFTLYFLAFTDDVPPSENITSPEIREWLYQRPYTTLELQHCYKREISDFIDPPKNNKNQAFTGYSIRLGNDYAKVLDRLNVSEKSFLKTKDSSSVIIRDPNNIPIELLS